MSGPDVLEAVRHIEELAAASESGHVQIDVADKTLRNIVMTLQSARNAIDGRQQEIFGAVGSISSLLTNVDGLYKKLLLVGSDQCDDCKSLHTFAMQLVANILSDVTVCQSFVWLHEDLLIDTLSSYWISASDNCRHAILLCLRNLFRVADETDISHLHSYGVLSIRWYTPLIQFLVHTSLDYLDRAQSDASLIYRMPYEDVVSITSSLLCDFGFIFRADEAFLDSKFVGLITALTESDRAPHFTITKRAVTCILAGIPIPFHDAACPSLRELLDGKQRFGLPYVTDMKTEAFRSAIHEGISDQLVSNSDSTTEIVSSSKTYFSGAEGDSDTTKRIAEALNSRLSRETLSQTTAQSIDTDRSMVDSCDCKQFTLTFLPSHFLDMDSVKTITLLTNTMDKSVVAIQAPLQIRAPYSLSVFFDLLEYLDSTTSKLADPFEKITLCEMGVMYLAVFLLKVAVSLQPKMAGRMGFTGLQVDASIDNSSASHDNERVNTLQQRALSGAYYPGYRTCFLAILARMIAACPTTQDYFRLVGGLELVLSHCAGDFGCPGAREWALACLKFATDGNEENRSYLARIVAEQPRT